METANQLKMEKKNIIWIVSTLFLLLMVFIILSVITIYIDPLFHYHAPLENYSYSINNERYQNDGILRNFSYNGVIIGSSMTENFMTSEADKLFNATFVKTPFSGGRYKEINDNLKKAFVSGQNINYVIRCLDYSQLINDKDSVREDSEYPTYLYNANPFDDINYVLNKSIFFDYTLNVLVNTKACIPSTSFDDYANWSADSNFGEKVVLDSYTLDEPVSVPRTLTTDEKQMILENVMQNVTSLADEHPETIFYFFFPPYSICYWDVLNNTNQINYNIEAELIAIKEILKHPNIKLYSFCNNFDLVCNLDNYHDIAHYGEWVNSQILEWMNNDSYLLTENNYNEYIQIKKEFYNSYDYNSLRK